VTSDRVRGLSAALTLFESMGEEAQEELGQLLGEIAVEGLAIQQSRVPVDTGDLQANLEAQVLVEALRARMGLLNIKSGRSRLFYGRPVDHGIRAQTVTVQRRRKVNGRLRTVRGRKRASDIVSTYSLKVKAREGVHFIEAPDLGQIADGKLDAFWERLEARAGGSA